MVQVFWDGALSFWQYTEITLGILFVIAWGGAVMRVLLNYVFAQKYSSAEIFSLSLAGWVIPVFTWAGIYFLFAFLLNETSAKVIGVVLFVVPCFFIRFKKWDWITFVLILLISCFVFLRLAFLQQAVFPAYFDSAEHYLNIQNILNQYDDEAGSLFRSIYYHLGYHIISAGLIHFFQWNITAFMLVFGQVVLAVLPISFFFLLKQITQSNQVGIFACLLAGVGLHMPSHLINWGKYPALLSLVGILFICNLFYILRHARHKKVFYGLIFISILWTALLHTRSVILFLFIFAVYGFTKLHQRLSSRFQVFVVAILLLVSVTEIFFIQKNGALNPLISSYIKNDLWILIFILILLPLTMRFYKALTFFTLASLTLWMLVLFIPIHVPTFGILTLLDRPYVQMLAYIPLVLLASLGFNVALKIMPKNKFTYPIIFIFFGFVLLNAKVNQKFYPSACCQLVTRDDLAAIAWIENNTPPDSVILTSSTQLYVTSYEGTALVAADAGVWIPPLTKRAITFFPSTYNFEANESHAQLCSQNIQYIYLGNHPNSFKQIQFTNLPNWYTVIFTLPQAQVLQVLGCD